MPMGSSEIVVIPKRFSGIRVLLIEPERNSLVEHAVMLSQNSYRVTSTTKVSIGLSMIQSGHLYDCILVDVDISEMDMVDFIHQVLRHQPELSIVMMLSDDIHTMRFVIEALKNEAILCLVKPCDLNDICNIWTHVCRKRIALEKYYSKRKSPQANNFLRRIDPMSKSLATFNSTMMINHEISRDQPMDKDQPPKDDIYQKKRKDNKPRINWTEELHGKFLEALNTLGNQKAYPSEILKHMNVPGLTRNQVASHLQKLQGREKVIKRPRMGDNLQAGNYASKRNGQSILSGNHGSIIQSNGGGGSQGNNVQMTGYGYNLSNNFNNGNFAVAGVSSDEVRAREPFGFDNGNSSNYSSLINTNGIGSMSEPLAQFDCFGIPIESPWPTPPMTNSRIGGQVEPLASHGLKDLGSTMSSRFFRMGRNSVGGHVPHETSIANQAMEDLALHEYVSHELGGFSDHPQDFQGNGDNLFMGFLHHSTNSNGFSNLNLEPSESVGFSFVGEGSNSTREILHMNSNVVYLGGVQEARVLNNDPFPHMTQFGVERTMQILDGVATNNLRNGAWQFSSTS